MIMSMLGKSNKVFQNFYVPRLNIIFCVLAIILWQHLLHFYNDWYFQDEHILYVDWRKTFLPPLLFMFSFLLFIKRIVFCHWENKKPWYYLLLTLDKKVCQNCNIFMRNTIVVAFSLNGCFLEITKFPPTLQVILNSSIFQGKRISFAWKILELLYVERQIP